MKFVVPAALLALTTGCGATGGSAALTCDALVSKTITTMEAAQGDDAMLHADDIPKLTTGCEKANSLETHARTAECVMGAGDFETMVGCDGTNQMLKKWMESA